MRGEKPRQHDRDEHGEYRWIKDLALGTKNYPGNNGAPLKDLHQRVIFKRSTVWHFFAGNYF